jgi:septal ring factor EnvC (AmiA/AmiB activator)
MFKVVTLSFCLRLRSRSSFHGGIYIFREGEIFMQDQGLGHSPAGKQQTNYRQAQTGRKTRENRQKTALFFVLIIFLWIGLVGAGYFAVRKHLQKSEQYFAGQMDELKAENQRITEDIVGAMQLFEQELAGSQEEMQQIRREMDMIQEELELTGESLTGTDATRQSLAERITELDQQLAGLQEQLRKLEAAVRAL